MEKVLSYIMDIFREFSGIINLALLFSLSAIVFKIQSGIIKNKETLIDILRVQNESIKKFDTTKNLSGITLLEEQNKVTTNILVDSIKALERQYEKVHLENESNKQVIEKELLRRQSIVNSIKENSKLIIKENKLDYLCGKYFVTGTNSESLNNEYYGEVKIGRTGDLLEASWEIGSFKEKHEGLGFCYGDSIAFLWTTEISREGEISKHYGIAIYEIISEKILKGKWIQVPIDKKLNYKSKIEEETLIRSDDSI
jgi:hypothetical protein